MPALQELTLQVIIKAARTKYLTTPVVEYVGRVGEKGYQSAVPSP
jgi:hypothetical protein